ncbi:TrkH family potassium uptake protein [Elizabethkingia sp. JS20170427COW]|uniref:TrkH family potassium uptake protein n=1 Tax=Elizabethkingia sp. JS20170427COW TaxID=2583851 RepID=UPI00111002EE|nr:potassium transporter TrkG [Elizabethkingia sp. JS20170427COW]QCX54056.1 potassium transporter [Elizabethkingia sp. JS20170427COW]
MNLWLKNKRGILQKIFTTILLLSISVPFIYPSATWINNILGHKLYFTFIMLIIALGTLSKKVMLLFNQKTNPAMLMAASFSLIIIPGALLLLSPRCNTGLLSITDSLFVATSAVCVTGLTPVDVSSVFTREGQIIIILLIQIGGLGVMTLTSFFAVFFMGNVKVSHQLTVKEMISSGTLNSLFSMLLYILGFTLAIEAIGAVTILYSIHGTLGMDLKDEIFFSIFHSISAFCNAGFSTLQGNLGNPLVMSNHNLLLITVSFLIIFGGIGFPILVNLVHLLRYYLQRFFLIKILRKKSVKKVTHIINVNTKIVLLTTIALLVGGTFMMLIFEWNQSFKNLALDDKLTHAFFNSASTRTAGFSSVNLSLFSTPTLLVYLFLMWIGGAAQSTAGGIKVNTFATALLSLKAILFAENRVEIFKREISKDSITRAYGTIFISMMVISVSLFILCLVEPNISLFKLTFEIFSAISTVGSSLDTTAQLSVPGKIIIMVLMFTGRIGIFTLLVSFIKQKPQKNYRFPEEQIIIN